MAAHHILLIYLVLYSTHTKRLTGRRIDLQIKFLYLAEWTEMVLDLIGCDEG